MKMKKAFLFASIAGLMLMVSSCADDDLSPIITFDKATKGAYVRLLQLISGEYDLDNYNTSTFRFIAEFVDEERGNLIQSYDIYVRFDGRVSGIQKPEVLHSSFGQGDFTTNERGYRQMEVSLPLAESATKLGLAQGEIEAGDFFVFRSELILNDGRVFHNENSSATVRGASFAGFFNFNAKATCPLPDNVFVGSYAVEYVTGNLPSPFGQIMGANPAPVTLRLVPGSTTLRDFDYIYLACTFNFAVSSRIDFVCTEVQFNTTNSGVGCGSGSITITEIEPSPVNILDDSEFRLKVKEFATDGGCGVGAIDHELLFTKQ